MQVHLQLHPQALGATPDEEWSAVIARRRAGQGHSIIEIVGQSFQVRPATADDASDMSALYAPVVEHTAISFELIPPERGKRIGARETRLRRDRMLSRRGIQTGFLA